MLKESFKTRMSQLLPGEEYEAFIRALESDDAVRGARVNLIKYDGKPPNIDGAVWSPLSYVDNGYILEGDVQIGRTPEHHAGMIYMQDPGAMSALAAIDISPEWWVADLCASPGGKSSQVAERLGEDGFLLANEYVPKRAKTVVGNFERLGIKNAIVTSMDTSELAELFSGTFDLCILDAPCSGEGMFRKSEEALAEWSPEYTEVCAERQWEIFKNAYKLLKPGGYLLYSTCTWSTAENEELVLRALDEYPELELVPVREQLVKVTRPGVNIRADERLSMTRRFYPHVAPGEGQFAALLKKRNDPGFMPTFLYKERTKELSREEKAIVEDFFSTALAERPCGRLIKSGENVVLISHGCPLPPHSVFMSGVLVGEIRRGILHPAHQFFSVYGKLFKLRECLERTDVRADEYLLGYEIATDSKESGWCAIEYRGATLGGGKMSGGRIKNHYPKGLRNK